jgi:integrase
VEQYDKGTSGKDNGISPQQYQLEVASHGTSTAPDPKDALPGRSLGRVAKNARQRAGVKPGVHILRHTFCSHLAMRGAPARAIQEPAGHQDLATTQRYMHLSPAAVEAAIRLLDQPAPIAAVVETH